MSNYFKFTLLVCCFLTPKTILASDYQLTYSQLNPRVPYIILKKSYPIKGKFSNQFYENTLPNQLYKTPPDEDYNMPYKACDAELNAKIFDFINSISSFRNIPFVQNNEQEVTKYLSYYGSGQYHRHLFQKLKNEKTKNCSAPISTLHRANYLAIVRIFIKQKNGEKVFKGSGFFITPHILFTDLHVIDEPFEGLTEENIFVQIPTVSQTAFASRSDIMSDIQREETPENPFLLDSLAKSKHDECSFSLEDKKNYPKIQNKLVPVKEIVAFSVKYDTALLKVEEPSKNFYFLEKKSGVSSKKMTLVGFPKGDFSILKALSIEEDNPMSYYKMVKIPHNENKKDNSMTISFSFGEESYNRTITINPDRSFHDFPKKYGTYKPMYISTPNYKPEEILNGASGAPLLFEDGNNITDEKSERIVAGALLGKEEGKRGVYRFVTTDKILELLENPISCNHYQCIEKELMVFLNRDPMESMDMFEQYKIAQLYEIKNELYPQAYHWYLRAAEQSNYPPAQMGLCRLYYYNCNIPEITENEEQGILQWCKKAAKNGYPEAQQILTIYNIIIKPESEQGKAFTRFNWKRKDSYNHPIPINIPKLIYHYYGIINQLKN